MYRCESWTIKKSEHQRIDSFKLWCWRRLLSVLWTARWSNQSILKEISPEYSQEGLILKLNIQYFGYLIEELTHWKDSEAGKDWGQEEKGTTEDEMVGWHHRLNGHEFEQTQEIAKDREAWCVQSKDLQRFRQDWVSEQQQNFEYFLLYHLKYSSFI